MQFNFALVEQQHLIQMVATSVIMQTSLSADDAPKKVTMAYVAIGLTQF